MPKAIRYDQPGGPDVMKWVDVEVGEPKAGEVRIRQHAVGLNYIDVYFRTGLYPQPLPGGLGMEAAGEVTAVGDGVTALKAGDRVAYVGQPPGAYAQERVMPAEKLVKLPDGISYDDAASVMLQGLTAHYLLRRTYPVKAGDTILIHAAAGGVGLLVCQWAKALGATVIGTVGSDEKAALAQAHGCDHPIVYTRENFTQRVKEITNGAGVPVVYDSIGKDTYIGSLDSLAPLGYFISFGNASGPLPPIDSKEFSSRGSLFFTRPTLFSYIAKRADLEAAAAELFDVILSGKVKTSINQRYPLAEVGRAHADLEARKTTGSTILVP
ncbi:quinone oxidoreductase [Burkholderia stabilis]|uniref:Quinone oxidoreductase 1,quinone oxidoreductase, NADPH-dependent,putative NAD(P)H quinone oxidoreductase, PIG3 family,Zinc-binding dehydrogenase n=1 Tax=Burkholderia stabilis TaxID=95485 RepID=A0AAJ5N7F1_9BURK|nr:quinone oxidoreductase [Burkholderia stabilis]AOR69180.1 quinone oxidoreductase [Burkholderia stabilis]VBB13188.1 Quinone oxidoreductase 1,quinone oxidoreductase, NADPH-dependent,putative NAD(P)H quinone oxidoreductase, PIG3 family,Zinc-binding dehydrogenase [Burkholderia stabilis]HDR9491395.1 quinone oxidoreductase [Burkholderia stabilis]HDR9525984.1 quinone oxidoreductase [Burkholderia stabilis]HDR9532242.1 quinone oxidoreductase [Burkholderia stabilis]